MPLSLIQLELYPNFICICSLYTLSMGKTWFNLTKNWIMLLQFDLKHIHKVNVYPSDNNFTQALLVLLVTNMISVPMNTNPWRRRGDESQFFPSVEHSPREEPAPLCHHSCLNLHIKTNNTQKSQKKLQETVTNKRVNDYKILSNILSWNNHLFFAITHFNLQL